MKSMNSGLKSESLFVYQFPNYKMGVIISLILSCSESVLHGLSHSMPDTY